jgi:hypothetical protein
MGRQNRLVPNGSRRHEWLICLLLGYLFAGLGAVCIVLLWFFIPDLTGRSYAQIDELFLRKIPARKFASTECTGHYGREVTDRDVEVSATAGNN